MKKYVNNVSWGGLHCHPNLGVPAIQLGTWDSGAESSPKRFVKAPHLQKPHCQASKEGLGPTCSRGILELSEVASPCLGGPYRSLPELPQQEKGQAMTYKALVLMCV